MKRNNLSFTRVTIDNQEVIADGRNLDEDITVARHLRLRAGDKTLNVEFSALNYGNERTGTYKCRLTGFENEWTQLQRGEHSVRYTNLPSGDYKLEVAYIADNGSPEDAMISLDISVSTFFWRTPWFWSAMILLLAVAGAYLYKRRIALLKKREERRLMEPIEKVFRESENPEELQTRIQDILHIQRRLKESSTKTADVDEQRTIANTRPFMEQVMKAMEANYNNSEFGVTELCGALGMSRTLLSRKLNAEVGVPASQFIRDYRLDIAKRLLQSRGRSATSRRLRSAWDLTTRSISPDASQGNSASAPAVWLAMKKMTLTIQIKPHIASPRMQEATWKGQRIFLKNRMMMSKTGRGVRK